jgi:cell division protein FtsI (penicillin-binding protein 3)
MNRPPLRQPADPLERLAILGLILLGWAFIILSRLFGLQVLAHEKYEKLAERQQEKVEPVQGQRGAIFDRDGFPLAISSPSHSLVVNPGRIPNKEIAAALIASVLKIDAQQLQRDLESAAASKRHRGYYIVDQHVTEEQAATLRDMKLEWADVSEGSVRNYPDGAVAAHVVGNVGGQGHGAAGIELKLEKELAGTPGLVRLERDGKEHVYASEIAKEPTVGRNVGLTIDRQLSHVAQDALRQAVVTNRAEHGSVVALDPRTGEVLALENYPTYDPNERLHPGQPPYGREDLAVVAPFEPGSVFKVITLSAALETTNLRPQSVINCGNGVMTLFTRVIHDHKPYSALSMQDVLAFSSNIGAIRIGMQVGNKNLYEYVRKFGFARRTGIELPAEAPGIVRPLKRWQPASIGSVPMGHEIAVTSVQLAQAGSVIANGGFLVHPHLIAWSEEPGGRKEMVKYPQPVQVLRPETVAMMRMMMRRVITEPGGTGHHLHVAGYTIAGKTGTAQIYDYAHRVYTHKYNASFLGFAPMPNPSVLVVVTVTGTSGEAGYGGWAAGPVFVKVMSEALRRTCVPRDVPEEVEELAAKESIAADKNKRSRELDVPELSTPLSEDEMQAATGVGSPDETEGAEEAASADASAPRVPNFVGKAVNDVMMQAAAQGVDVEMLGEGIARDQNPAAGSVLIPGEHIRVRFAR